MQVKNLNHQELMELVPECGIIRFAGQRALLIDAVAMGILRKYLVENFGMTATRTVLTQFGFAHGWRMAEAMQSQLNWDKDPDWRLACTHIHALQGLYHVMPESSDPMSRDGMSFIASYEAGQHLLHFGQADAPCCWTICGLISGYLSRVCGEDICVLEDRCMSMGDSHCHLIGRTRQDWGNEHAEELAFFKPDRLKDCLEVSLRRVTDSLVVAEKRLLERRRMLVRAIPLPDEPLGLVNKSQAMRQILDLAHRVAKVDATVLITGESGTGKERIARLIHSDSLRARGPFIPVNCGAITETLLESELFGHTRGSFSGATQDRIGLFEAANGGTLLLDEVGEVSPGMQVKLLRAIQEREIRRVGENKNRQIDVRILAATNRDLAKGVFGGVFRQDLYYRLKVVELRVPPLRERKEDILPLARILLAGSTILMKRKISGFTPRAADQLMRYQWPGNVRESENAMERAAALATGNRVELEDLPEEVRQMHLKQATPLDTGTVQSLEEVEKAYILTVLDLNGGNQTHAAKQLQIGAATLYRKLKSYGMIIKRDRAHATDDGGEEQTFDMEAATGVEDLSLVRQ